MRVLDVPTDQGPGRVHVHPAAATPHRGTLVLGHGAGGGTGSADLQAATRLTRRGWHVVLVDQPWRVAGKRVAVAPPRLDAAWRQLLPAAHEAAGGTRPLVVGGRSAGARVACRTAAESDPGPRADAVLCLAFPLHPPGRPERSRREELLGPPAHGIPALVVQGRQDPFGSPEEVRAALNGEWPGPVQVRAVPGRHSPTTDPDLLLSEVGSWLDALP